MAKAKKGVPEGYHTVTPSLTLDNATDAIEWYKRALGATEIGRHVGPDGKIMHAELQIGDSKIMLNDPMMGGRGPKSLGGSPVSLYIYVDDCDAAFKRAIAAGATETMPVDDQFWGDRLGVLADPHGYTWTLATRKEDLTHDEVAQRGEAFFKQMSQGAPH